MLCCPLDQTFTYLIRACDLIPILLCVIYLLYNQEGSKLYFCSQNFSTILCVCNQQQKWQLNLQECRTLWGKHEQAMYCGIELLLIVIICFTSVGQYLLRLVHVCQKVFVVPQSCERVPTHEREPTPYFWPNFLFRLKVYSNERIPWSELNTWLMECNLLCMYKLCYTSPKVIAKQLCIDELN